MVAEDNYEAIIADHVSYICMGSDYCSIRNIIYSTALGFDGKREARGLS